MLIMMMIETMIISRILQNYWDDDISDEDDLIRNRSFFTNYKLTTSWAPLAVIIIKIVW